MIVLARRILKELIAIRKHLEVITKHYFVVGDEEVNH